jgi:hypothetical protein
MDFMGCLQGDQEPMLLFFKYFRQKNGEKFGFFDSKQR